MRIPPSGSRPIGSTEPAVPKSGAPVIKKPFAGAMSSPSATKAAATVRAADIIDDVKALAHEVKGGLITKEEASKRFVSIVIEKRHDLSALGDPKAKQVEDAIREIAGDDPGFVSRLSAQLSQLAKA